MPRRSTGTYPPDWKDIARRVKTEAGWKCVRCGHDHAPQAGYCLTVHHLDLDPSNNRWHNLAALCQRCHLSIQSRIVMEQVWPFDHTPWFRPYVAGYNARRHGLPDDRANVLANLETYLFLA